MGILRLLEEGDKDVRWLGPKGVTAVSNPMANPREVWVLPLCPLTLPWSLSGTTGVAHSTLVGIPFGAEMHTVVPLELHGAGWLCPDWDVHSYGFVTVSYGLMRVLTSCLFGLHH